MKTLIYGNGRIARVVYQYTKVSHLDIVGFTVEHNVLGGSASTFLDLPIYPFEEIDLLFDPNEYHVLIAVGYADMNSLRASIFKKVKAKGYSITNFIHPAAIIHADLVIGTGNIILDGVCVQPEVKIGDNNFIWSNAVVAHGVTIENDCWIASGSVIAGDSCVESKCFLGVNASVSNGIRVCTETFVGANSLISKNTKPSAVHLSRPAEVNRLDSRSFLQFIG